MRKILTWCLLAWGALFIWGCVNKDVLTHLPCDSYGLLWMQPYGYVDHGGGNSFFHDGIDFGNPDGEFYASADGNVTEVDLDTGKGWPGTNYRITIQATANLMLDYHFEIGGTASLDDRMLNVFVAVGDQVTAGQHIANLISIDSDVAHVHWGINENWSADTCPLEYCTSDVATGLEALYDSGIEKRPANRPDLCE